MIRRLSLSVHSAFNGSYQLIAEQKSCCATQPSFSTPPPSVCVCVCFSVIVSKEKKNTQCGSVLILEMALYCGHLVLNGPALQKHLHGEADDQEKG